MSLDVDCRKASINIVVENKDYESDMKLTTYYTQVLLAILGIWPLVKQNYHQRELILSTILIITGMLLISFVMIPIAVVIVKVTTLTGFLKLFGPIAVCLSNFVKYCLFIYRRKLIRLCFEHVEYDWKTASSDLDREIMRKSAIVGRRVSLLCMVFMYTSGLIYHTLMPIWRGKKARALNQTIRPLPYPVYDLFVNSQATPQYEIIFSTSCISACYMYTIIVAACSLSAIFVSHACGQIGIIVSRLETLFDNLNDNIELLNTRVSFVIRSHVRVLRLAETIEVALKEIFLTEVISSTLIICLLEWRLTQWQVSDNVTISTYFIVLISVTFNLFIFCYSSELLMEQCKLIGKATYLSDWWKMRGRNGQALILLIAMANIPRRLTAGGMMELSVASFGAIIRTSVAYLNMLRTFNV